MQDIRHGIGIDWDAGDIESEAILPSVMACPFEPSVTRTVSLASWLRPETRTLPWLTGASDHCITMSTMCEPLDIQV
jgi:hypothetical protein